jgi:hypothetical protein
MAYTDHLFFEASPRDVTEIRRHQVEKVRAFLPFSITFISSNLSAFAKTSHAQHRHLIALRLPASRIPCQNVVRLAQFATMRLLALLRLTIVAVNAYYTLSVYAPSLPQIHARIINARNKAFIIGATKPSTFCGLDNATECPDGTSTQVDGNMTGLAVRIMSPQSTLLLTGTGCSPRWSIHLRRPRRNHILPTRTLRPPTSRLTNGRLPSRACHLRM